MSLSAPFAAIAITVAGVGGQSPGSGQRRPLRSSVDVIGMNVTAIDRARHFVTDLSQDDFQVLEDGRPRRVTFFQKGRLPLALALLIDSSNSRRHGVRASRRADNVGHR